jgi:hypothetical protein
MFYNTINLDNKKLITALLKADNQQMKVKIIFNAIGAMTASKVHSFFPANVPLTSIRRAITDLKNEGFLLKSETMQPGLFGMPEHVYKLNNEPTLF